MTKSRVIDKKIIHDTKIIEYKDLDTYEGFCNLYKCIENTINDIHKEEGFSISVKMPEYESYDYYSNCGYVPALPYYGDVVISYLRYETLEESEKHNKKHNKKHKKETIKQ